MSNAQKYVRIENLTAAAIELPPIPANEQGIAQYPVRTLIPGGNNVLTDYLAALAKFTVTDKFNKVHAPHAALLERMTNAGQIKVDTDPKACKRPEGPEPPRTLQAQSVDVAMELIRAEESLARLQLWEKTERRDQVKSALVERIAKVS
jgi:hypothetical protein